MWSGLSACTSVSLALLRSADKLKAVLIVDAIQIGGAQALGLTLAAYSHNRVNAYLYGVEIAQAIALSVGLLSLPPARRLWRERAVLGRVLVFSLPVLPQLLSNFVLGTSDRLIIGSDLGPVPVGRYQIAYGLACTALLMVGVLTAQWLPSLLRVRELAARRQAIAAARDRLGDMLIPVVLGLCAGLPELLRFWVSGEYHPAGLTTVVVAVAASTIPFTLYSCHSLVLFIQGSTKLITVINVVAALVNVGLNLVLVPSLHIDGSAYATLVAYVVLWMAASLATRGSEIRPGPSRRIAGSVVVTALLAGGSVFVPITGPAGILRWIVAGGCVVALAVMVRTAGRSLPAGDLDPAAVLE
jgi:O-antigen/teichoic acid export membrane protein